MSLPSLPYGMTNAKSSEEEKNLYLDRPMRGKSQDQIKRHSLESSIENKPIERSLYILSMGDVVQKISVVHSLPQLIQLDSAAVYTRIIPKIKQDLPSSSCEFQIATSAIFMILLQKSANISILQSVIQGVDAKDPNVAFAWSEALFGSLASLPEIIIQNFVMPLAKQKFQPNSTVISKIFCGKLMGEVCSCTRFRLLDVRRDILPIVIGLCQDGHADVRAQMCSFIPKVAAVLGNDWEKTNLLSCIVDLAQDENLNVRSTSIVAIRSMLKILSQDTSRNTLLPLIKKLCTRACEESLITALILSDEFGALMLEMPFIHDQDVLFFINIYKHLSLKGKQGTVSKANSSLEVTIRQRCATNVYGIMKLVNNSLPSQVHEVYVSFRDHANDPCFLVRKAAAGVLSSLAQLLGNDNKIMKNEIVRLLRDDAVEVLEAIVPTISVIFTCLAGSGALSYQETSQISIELGKALIKCQTELSKRYNWRLTIAFLQQLEVLPTCFPSDYIHNNFTPAVFDKLIYGKAKPVRNQAARTLVVFMRYNFKPNQTKWIRDSLIRQTAQSRSAYSRILYIYVCEAVLSIYSEKYFKEWFLPPCLALATDRIANIRWKFIQFSSRLKAMVTLASDAATKQKIMDTLTKIEGMEKARTVLDMIRIKKREPMPKYSAEALREEELRVRDEGTTNIVRSNNLQSRSQSASQAAQKRVSMGGGDMHFLEQHFYIDAGIKLESILGLKSSAKDDSETHLDPSDLLAIENCNITDDAKVNLRNSNKFLSKSLKSLASNFNYDSDALPESLNNQNKRHSSVISLKCLETTATTENFMQRRRSLNLNTPFSESKIPIATRAKSLSNVEKIVADNPETKIVVKTGISKISALPVATVESRNKPAPKRLSTGRAKSVPARGIKST